MPVRALRLLINSSSPGNVPHQRLLSIFMNSMARLNNVKAILHHKLVESSGHHHGRDADQDTNGRVVLISERLTPKEDGGHDSRTQVSRHVHAQRIGSKAPCHGAVSQANNKGSNSRRDKWVGRVDARPDDETDEAVAEELGKEDISHRLVRVGKRAQDTRRGTVCNKRFSSSEQSFLHLNNLLVVNPHEHQSGNEAAEELAKDVMRHLLQRKPLPHAQRNRHSRTEVPTRGRRTSNNGKGNTKRKREADGEEAAKGRGADRVGGVEGEGGDGADAGQDVHEDAGGLCDALAQPARPGVFEVEAALRHAPRRDDVAGGMFLDDVGCSQLHCMRVSFGMINGNIGAYSRGYGGGPDLETTWLCLCNNDLVATCSGGGIQDRTESEEWAYPRTKWTRKTRKTEKDRHGWQKRDSI